MTSQLRDLLGHEVELLICKRLPCKMESGCKVMLEFHDNCDKESIIVHHTRHGSLTFEDWDIGADETQYESVQSEFNRYVLNVNKYSSRKACMAELGTFPLCNIAWSHAVITCAWKMVRGTSY